MVLSLCARNKIGGLAMTLLNYNGARHAVIEWFAFPEELLSINEPWIDYHAKGYLAWRIVTDNMFGFRKRAVSEYFDFHSQLAVAEKFRTLHNAMMEEK